MRWIEKDYVKDADAARGRFRTFLIATLKHFLANEWDRTKAVKRGARVLDKANPNSVLYESSVVDTPNADPAAVHDPRRFYRASTP